jgi:2-dehydropantoate 2-reductase
MAFWSRAASPSSLPANPKIIICGAGVIGGTVGAWLAPHYDNLFLVDRGEIAATLRRRGITTYAGDRPEEKTTVPVKVLDDLGDAPDADIVIFGVKNYSLDAVAAAAAKKLGDRPIAIGMQNGAENQRILPKYFSKVAYCVIAYNAWADEPGVIGYQKKGPLVLGTLQGELAAEMDALAAILGRGVETVVSPHIQDAVHSKLVINLANSFTTLIGHGQRDIADPALFQKILSGMAYEGVQIVREAGYHECSLGGMPGWRLIWAAANLPTVITRPLFEKNVRKMVMSSMAQDVIQRRSGDTELTTINGYLLQLADVFAVAAPLNRAVYELCRREFAKPDFQPLDIRDAWRQMQEISPAL